MRATSPLQKLKEKRVKGRNRHRNDQGGARGWQLQSRAKMTFSSPGYIRGLPAGGCYPVLHLSAVVLMRIAVMGLDEDIRLFLTYLLPVGASGDRQYTACLRPETPVKEALFAHRVGSLFKSDDGVWP